MSAAGAQFHPLVFPAFIWAVLVLLLPTQAGIVFGALSHGRTGWALVVVVVTILVAALPLELARRDIRREPKRWKPRILSKVTWGIVALNAALNAVVFVNIAMR